MHPAPQILRSLADIARRRGWSGYVLPWAVDAYRREREIALPAAVASILARIRWRGRHLSPDGVACVLRARAGQLERAGANVSARRTAAAGG